MASVINIPYTVKMRNLVADTDVRAEVVDHHSHKRTYRVLAVDIEISDKGFSPVNYTDKLDTTGAHRAWLDTKNDALGFASWIIDRPVTVGKTRMVE